MDWTELLTKEMEYAYGAADKLLDLVDEERLDWRPQTGENWMTMGQLLGHLATACGAPTRGFVTGDWGMPADAEPAPEDMLPPADRMPSVETVPEAKAKLAKDRELALAMVKEAGEEALAGRDTVAPWDPTPMKLGHRLLHMVGHLANHKAQLFYYLKLQGTPVNTMHLYGM